MRWWTIFPIFLLTFLGILLFWNLGTNYLANWDEAWYADISRNLTIYRNPLHLIWNTRPFFDKPPLYMWLSAISFNIFGVNEFSARFISALSGVGCGIMVYLIGKKLFDARAGIVALLVLLSSIGFLYRSRTGNLDTLLTFCLLLVIYGYFSRKFLLLGIGLVLGFLTKGFIIAIFPLLAFGSQIIIKDSRDFKNRRFWAGIILAVLISGGWIAVSYLTYGQVFLDRLMANQLGKVNSSTSFINNFSLEYIQHLKSALKIWFIFFVPGFVIFCYFFRKTKAIILAIYVVFYLALLSFSENKSNWFLLPVLPIAAIIIGGSFSRLTKNWKLKLVQFGLTGLFIISLLQLYYYRDQYFVADTSVNEAKVAITASQLIPDNQPIYISDSFYPTAVYYSRHPVYAVFGSIHREDTWWILPRLDWEAILESKPVAIITSPDDQQNLEKDYPSKSFETVYQSGNRKLIILK